MLLSPLQQLLWALYAIATAAVIVALVWKRLIRAWPSLFALCTFQLLTTLVLFTVRHHYAWYFYTYWATSPIQSLLRLALLVEIIGCIPGTQFIARRFKWIVVSASSVIGLVAAVTVHTGHIAWIASSPGHKHQILESVLLFDRSISFFCLACCLLATTIVYLIGFGWDGCGPMIVSALAVQLTAFAFSSVLWSYFHQIKPYAEYFDEAVRIVVLCLWTHSLLHTSNVESRAATQ
jgi:hypothetical protein